LILRSIFAATNVGKVSEQILMDHEQKTLSEEHGSHSCIRDWLLTIIENLRATYGDPPVRSTRPAR
jgi:hypothetical protein